MRFLDDVVVDDRPGFAVDALVLHFFPVATAANEEGNEISEERKGDDAQQAVRDLFAFGDPVRCVRDFVTRVKGVGSGMNLVQLFYIGVMLILTVLPFDVVVIRLCMGLVFRFMDLVDDLIFGHTCVVCIIDDLGHLLVGEAGFVCHLFFVFDVFVGQPGGVCRGDEFFFIRHLMILVSVVGVASAAASVAAVALLEVFGHIENFGIGLALVV